MGLISNSISMQVLAEWERFENKKQIEDHI